MNTIRKCGVAALLSIATSPAALAAGHSYNYSGEAYASVLNAFQVNAASPHSMYYVDNAAGTASNTSGAGIHAPVGLYRATGWTFDFSNPAAVAFTGHLQLGDYKVQTNMGSPTTADGRQTYTGVVHSFSGVGSYDEGTNTFTYIRPSAGPNTGGGSVYSAATPASCANGQGSFFFNVCAVFAAGTRDWEGLELKFFFSEDRTRFAGQLQGIERSGTAAGMNTTTINWAIDAEVPVPAAAWLFGSGLLGLAVARRRRR
jgi:hypothetical protein